MDDLSAPLAEFELRYEAGDFDDAARVLLEIDFNYLMVWGHNQVVAHMHERLKGKISEPSLKHSSIGNLGTVYYHLKEFEKAVGALETAIKINPVYAEAYNQLGVALTESGKYDKALIALTEAIRLSSEKAVFYYNLGYLYNQLGKFKPAIDALEKSRRLAPDYFDALLNLGYAYGRQKEYRNAISAMREAVELKPDDAPARYFLGKLYLLAKDKPSALAQYQLVEPLDARMAQQLYEFIYRDKLLVIERK